jgi:uncharacterized protein (TIGR02757 family)
MDKKTHEPLPKKPRRTDHGRWKARLEILYDAYHAKPFVHPDPVAFLYDYPDPKDREIVGMIAACLAYGRVGQILKSVSRVLEKMVPSPSIFLNQSTPNDILKTFDGFVHRFATGRHLSFLLVAIKALQTTHGSLNRLFLSGFSPRETTVANALKLFARQMVTAASGGTGHLIPLPERGSACKRLNLFLRWMVRCDAVDPGGWEGIPAGALIVPLDTHLHRLSRWMGFTTRKSPGMPAALEVTRRFRQICPADPVRYDFVLTRFGIREDLQPEDLHAHLGSLLC